MFDSLSTGTRESRVWRTIWGKRKPIEKELVILPEGSRSDKRNERLSFDQEWSSEKAPGNDRPRPVHEGFPFDLRTKFVCLFRWKWLLLAGMIVSCAAGLATSAYFGKRTYVAEVALLLDLTKESPGTGPRALPSLATQLLLVKLPANIEKVKESLSLSDSLPSLTSRFEVATQKDTSLMRITASGETPALAADLANALGRVFLESLDELRQTETKDYIEPRQRQLERVKNDLTAADDALEAFLRETGVIGLERESTDLEQKYISTDLLYEEAKMETSAAETRITEYTDEITQIKSDIGKAALVEQGLADAKAHIGELKESLKTAEKELAKLQLEKVSLEGKQSHWEKALSEIQGSLSKLPEIQQRNLALRRDVNELEAQKDTLENDIAAATAAKRTLNPERAIISKAMPPETAARSTRRLILLGVVMAGNGCCAAFVLLIVFLDNKIRSSAECVLKTGLPVLAEVPSLPATAFNLSQTRDPRLHEVFRLTMVALRKKFPTRGTRLLVLSSAPGEGASFVAASIAMTMGRADERVLLINCGLRNQRPAPMDSTVQPGDKPLSGLAQYLSFECEDHLRIAWPTSLAGVTYVPSMGSCIDTDVLASNRMRELLEAASERFSFVVLDSPPAHGNNDSIILAERCDGILLVVRAGQTTAAALKRTMERLEISETPILGIVLNGVEPPFAQHPPEKNKHPATATA